MSSTNRNKTKRSELDYYVTPQKAIEVFLTEFINDVDLNMKRPYVLDPCAGGDKDHEMSYPAVINKMFPKSKVITLDIREDSRAKYKVDYLTAKITKKPDIIITNPLFYLAKEIIEKALTDVKEGGCVIMPLRLNFFGSNQRFEFFKKYVPAFTYVHHRRFSFTDNKKTDSIEYMHCVWQKNNYPKFTKLRVI